MNLEEIFNQKLTENGDIAFTKISAENILLGFRVPHNV